MIETAAADGATQPAGAVTSPSGLAARDLDPVTVNDTIFDDPDYTPLDLYGIAGTADTAPALPVVASCPHAGRSYPASMLAASREPVGALRGLEDFGVDCLLPGLADAGIPTVINRLSRAYIDVNRDPSAVDASMFNSVVSTRPPCHHVRAGYGDPATDRGAKTDLHGQVRRHGTGKTSSPCAYALSHGTDIHSGQRGGTVRPGVADRHAFDAGVRPAEQPAGRHHLR